MDQITQANASSSEELAAGSQELSSQAFSMNDFVSDLVGLVDGEKAKITRVETSTQKIRAITSRTKNLTKTKHLISFNDDNNFRNY